MTIGEATSRIRNVVKAVKSDAFLTDRLLYSLILKYGKALIKKQDSLNQLVKYASLFRTIPCADLVEINKIEACCEIKSDCLFKRTKEKIKPMEATFGPIFRFVSSIDGSFEFILTNPSTYRALANSSSFKYNRNKYYWYLNNYLYFPDLQWDAVKIDGVFEDDISVFSCEPEEKCVYRQEQLSPIPDFLFADIDRFVLQELGISYQLPEDVKPDKENLLR